MPAIPDTPYKNLEGKKTNKNTVDSESRENDENSPWILFGNPIELTSLSNKDFWTKVAFNEDDNTKTLKFRIILPSSKFIEADDQLPLISDSMFLPETIANIANIIRETDIKLDVKTFFDIDVVQQIGNEFELQDDILSDCNLILTATGDINLATRLLLQHELLLNIRPGPTNPNSSSINGINKKYPAITNQDLGLLSVLRSPFNDNRIAILACGTLAIGTIGAQKLLNLYITGKANRIGNNRLNKEIPAKIVKFEKEKYDFDLKNWDECTPEMELLNVNVSKLIDEIGVVE